MNKKQTKNEIELTYLLGGWNPQKWEGSIDTAMGIALAEISEHAGGHGSAAYRFTSAIFDRFDSIRDEKRKTK